MAGKEEEEEEVKSKIESSSAVVPRNLPWCVVTACFPYAN
jgi:hypothetical protein